jgi:hypothetical protein
MDAGGLAGWSCQHIKYPNFDTYHQISALMHVYQESKPGPHLTPPNEVAIPQDFRHVVVRLAAVEHKKLRLSLAFGFQAVLDVAVACASLGALSGSSFACHSSFSRQLALNRHGYRNNAR